MPRDGAASSIPALFFPPCRRRGFSPRRWLTSLGATDRDSKRSGRASSTEAVPYPSRRRKAIAVSPQRHGASSRTSRCSRVPICSTPTTCASSPTWHRRIRTQKKSWHSSPTSTSTPLHRRIISRPIQTPCGSHLIRAAPRLSKARRT